MKVIISSIALLGTLKAFALSGTQIAEKVYNSNREADSIQKIKMTLTDKSGSKRVRQFTMFGKDNNRYDSQSLIQFTAPKKISKTGMLTHNKSNESSDQWIYLPALKKTRRISSGKKNGRFVGSDLTYEDLEDREVKLDNHNLKKTETINGVKHYILESIPKDKSSSMYSKVISKINSQTWMATSAEFYKKKKQPYKTLVNKSFKKSGSTWYPTLTIIKDHKIGHQTTLEVLSAQFNNGLKSNVFKKSILETPKKLNKYLE